jgi:hypothetical protein
MFVELSKKQVLDESNIITPPSGVCFMEAGLEDQCRGRTHNTPNLKTQGLLN